MKRAASLLLLLLLLMGCAARLKPEPVVEPAPAPVPVPSPVPAPVVQPPAPEPVVPGWIEAEVKGLNGAWQPLQDGATYPGKDLTFRMRFHGLVDQVALRQRLGEGVQILLTGPEQAEVMVANPSRVIHLKDLGEPGRMLRFYTGQPPRVVALDPATGQEQALGEVPADMQSMSLSPDGKQVVGYFLKDQLKAQAFLLDLASGQRWERPHAVGLRFQLAWWEGVAFLASGGRVQAWAPQTDQWVALESKTRCWQSVSPDGRYLAGFTYDPNEVYKYDWMNPATVVIFDLKERTERLYPDVARAQLYTHGYEFPMIWTPDGTSLLLRDRTTRQSFRSVRLDLASGQVTEVAAETPNGDPWALTYPGPGGWAYRLSEWGPVKLVGPDGKEHEWGQGRTVGWLPDGRLLLIRWENSDHRIIWGM